MEKIFAFMQGMTVIRILCLIIGVAGAIYVIKGVGLFFRLVIAAVAVSALLYFFMPNMMSGVMDQAIAAITEWIPSGFKFDILEAIGWD